MSRAAAPPRAGAEALADNRTGILLMLAATALFSAEDALIKLATATMPAGQVIAALGAGGSVVFALAARRTGTRVLTRDALVPEVLLRNLGEAIAAVGIVTALALSPLSSTLAILQATPLALVAGAGLTLGERVGWRRGVAVAAGFAGVLMIVRPGLAELQPGSVFAVIAVAGLTLRDLVSRRVPRRIGTLQLSAWAYVALMPAGLALMLAAGEAPVGPDARGWALLVATVCVGAVGYAAITGAVLLGEVAVVAPLRYVRLVLAMLIGVVFFAERPDAWTLAGAAVILASGLYTLGREARLGATGAASITRTGTRS